MYVTTHIYININIHTIFIDINSALVDSKGGGFTITFGENYFIICSKINTCLVDYICAPGTLCIGQRTPCAPVLRAGCTKLTKHRSAKS